LAKVGEFIAACKLYIRMRLRGESVEGQVQRVLLYVQGGSADVWKENIMEELESGEIEYELAEEFLTSLNGARRGKNLCRSSREQQGKVDMREDH